jgi:hypothetical protein
LAAVNTDPKSAAVIIAISQQAWKRSATRARSGTIGSAAGLWRLHSVAEVPETAFTIKSQRSLPADRRPVRDLNRRAAARQAELFPVWRYHAAFTDPTFEPVQAEPAPPSRDHRIFVDVTDGPLATCRRVLSGQCGLAGLHRDQA